MKILARSKEVIAHQTTNLDHGCFMMIIKLHVDYHIHVYRQVSNISRTIAGNKIVDHSCTWSIACQHCCNYIFILNLMPGIDSLGKDNCKTRRETLKVLGIGVPYIRDLMVDLIFEAS